MRGFNYKNKSTENILISSRLILATFEDLNSITGVERESVKGEQTITRPIPNDFGTKSSPLTFQYALVKENGDPFTDQEQIIVERWLTSPKFSSDLYVIEDGILIAAYCGKFISTEWKSCIGGWAGVIFNFENNCAYPKKHFEYKYDISGDTTLLLECESDELEEYIYPTFTIAVLSDTTSVSITNLTDSENTMTIQSDTKVPVAFPMIFDCQHCIISDGTTSGIISYKDLGWNDVGNIYWLRLLPGANEIKITGCESAKVKFEFDAPYKKVGGWMS